MKIVLNDDDVLGLLKDLDYIWEKECDTIYGRNFYRGMIRMMKDIVGWDYEIEYNNDKLTHEMRRIEVCK